MSQVSRIFDFFSAKRVTSSSVPDAEIGDRDLDPGKIERLHRLTSHIPTGGDDVNAWNEECASLIDELVISRLPRAELASILAGLISYQKTGVTASQSHMAYISAFGRTSGLFQEILHYGMFPRSGTGDARPITSPHFGTIDDASRTEVMNTLRDTGYAVLPFTLDAASVERLSDAARMLSFRTREPFAVDVPDSIASIDPANPPLCGAVHAAKAQLAASPVFRALADDPLIVSLASEYLETPVSAIDEGLWYSFPAASASSELAQLFHYDLDTLRWLKVFYYLNDVSEANGPHEYIEGSHKSGAKNQRLLDRGYTRINDDDMRQMQSGKLRSVVGPAGTVILGDTRAFHKGQHVRSGHRLIYSPIYAPSRLCYTHAA